MEFQRESIFVSALRGFCKSLFIVFGIFAGLTVVSLIFMAFSSSYKYEEKTTLEILPDLDWKKELAPLNSPVVLQINIHGIIGQPEQIDTATINAILFDSRQGMLQHDRVKAILLHFDTPGGSAFDSDNIYRLLTSYKEKFHVPIYGYIEGLCASGGMYIASSTDRLYSSPCSIIGSVGVISGPYLNFYDAMTKIGIQSKTLTEGIDKDSMNPLRPWKPDEDQVMKNIQVYLYNQFVDIVTQARPRLDKTKLVEEYGAKIFPPTVAQEYGYIDVANASYNQALSDLMADAKIDSSKPYQVVQLKPHKGILNELVQGSSTLFSGKIKHTLDLNADTQAEEPFAYLYRP